MLRYVSLALSMTVVILLTAECIRRWPVMPARYRRVVPPLIAVFTVAAYGSGEAAAQHAPQGLRVALFATSLCWLVGALLVNAFQRPDATVYADRRR